MTKSVPKDHNKAKVKNKSDSEAKPKQQHNYCMIHYIQMEESSYKKGMTGGVSAACRSEDVCLPSSVRPALLPVPTAALLGGIDLKSCPLSGGRHHSHSGPPRATQDRWMPILHRPNWDPQDIPRWRPVRRLMLHVQHPRFPHH